jgi:hypothetical protein
MVNAAVTARVAEPSPGSRFALTALSRNKTGGGITPATASKEYRDAPEV